jgi:hypothetical protein
MNSFLNWFIKPAAAATVEFEVGTGLDAFMSLEDLAPGANWQELLADAWGVPYNAAAPQPSQRTEGTAKMAARTTASFHSAVYGTAS